jgi:hypothetical protein
MWNSWRSTSVLHSLESRLSHTVGETAVGILITSLTDGLSFSIGTITQFPAVRMLFFGGMRAVLSSWGCFTGTLKLAELVKELIY